jgi:hypothetical protein
MFVNVSIHDESNDRDYLYERLWDVIDAHGQVQGVTELDIDPDYDEIDTSG